MPKIRLLIALVGLTCATLGFTQSVPMPKTAKTTKTAETAIEPPPAPVAAKEVAKAVKFSIDFPILTPAENKTYQDLLGKNLPHGAVVFQQNSNANGGSYDGAYPIGPNAYAVVSDQVEQIGIMRLDNHQVLGKLRGKSYAQLIATDDGNYLITNYSSASGVHFFDQKSKELRHSVPWPDSTARYGSTWVDYQNNRAVIIDVIQDMKTGTRTVIRLVDLATGATVYEKRLVANPSMNEQKAQPIVNFVWWNGRKILLPLKDRIELLDLDSGEAVGSLMVKEAIQIRVNSTGGFIAKTLNDGLYHGQIDSGNLNLVIPHNQLRDYQLGPEIQPGVVSLLLENPDPAAILFYDVATGKRLGSWSPHLVYGQPTRIRSLNFFPGSKLLVALSRPTALIHQGYSIVAAPNFVDVNCAKNPARCFKDLKSTSIEVSAGLLGVIQEKVATGISNALKTAAASGVAATGNDANIKAAAGTENGKTGTQQNTRGVKEYYDGGYKSSKGFPIFKFVCNNGNARSAFKDESGRWLDGTGQPYGDRYRNLTPERFAQEGCQNGF